MSVPLRFLSDQEVLSRTKVLTARERKLTLRLLLHLNEIERRRLHLKQGYASMFVYCTTGLGYSASAAKRRICTARCIARYPEVLGLLECNEVNLSTVTQVSRILRPDNSRAVLARIRGKSQREVEAVVAEYEPLAALPRERVRTVVVRVPTPSPAPATAIRREVAGESRSPEAALAPSEAAIHTDVKDRSGPEETPPVVHFVRRALIQFSADESVMSKLERVRSLASHRLPGNASLEQLVEFLANYFTEREDPKARQERREAKARNAGTKAPHSTTVESPRNIPARVKDQVLLRDNQQCTYVGANGRRCASAHVLQVDHVKPWARGGASTMENLRVLCAYHNRLEAERLMGRCGPRDAATRP